MDVSKTHKVILYNDNKLTFDFVICCLVEICNHTLLQAEQCALVAHNTGQVNIASGSFDEMYRILETLDYLNVNSSLEEYESDLHR